jgi:hypothetical protein
MRPVPFESESFLRKIESRSGGNLNAHVQVGREIDTVE